MPPLNRLVEASVKLIEPAEIDTLAKWVAAGAPEVAVEPDVAATAPDPLVTDQDRELWALQPPEAPTRPALGNRPVLFVCENTLYMEYTPIADVTAVARPAADRAPAYGIPGEVVDGNDVVAVREAVAALARRARAGEGPALLEAETYRHFGHSRADPATYRPAEEVERWLKHDPLDLARGRLLELGMPEERVIAADERARHVVEQAVEAAKNAPPPDPREALADVWADGGAGGRTW